MADTKIASLTAGTAASTDRIPTAISPYGSGDNRYLTPITLMQYLNLNQDAANVLGLRNGTTAQTNRLYNTWTDASNGEWLEFGFATNVPYIRSTKNGTGTQRALNLGGSGVNNWQIDTSGHFIPLTSGTYNIGTTAATVANIYIGGSNAVIFGINSQIYSQVNGNLTLYSHDQDIWNLLQFGGTTSSFPAIKRSSAILQARLANDSAFTQIQGKLMTDANATTGLTAGVLAALTNASITITDASGQVYRIPCII